jgi:phosphatidylglycerophosphatase C
MAQDGLPSGAADDEAVTGPRPLVAFDFDGTLTVRDSFTAFLRWRAGPMGFALGLARLAPSALAYLIHRDRGRIKAAAVRIFLRGEGRAELDASARAFADARIADLLRPDAKACWADWRARSVRLIIVTASPSFVVAPFAQALQADDLIGTELAFDAQGRATGAFATPNCRGPEKVVRLRARYGPQTGLDAAYGDTAGDREMLQIAKTAGYQVFSGRP